MNLKDPQDYIKAQLALEDESVMLGRQRYRADDKLPWQSGQPGQKEEADLAPGRALLKRAVEPTAAAIDTFIEEAGTGKAGRKHAALPYLCQVDAMQAAYLTARVAVNCAATHKTAQATAMSLGSALQQHIELVTMRSEHAGLYRKVMDQVERATSAQHRTGVLNHVKEKYGLTVLSWSQRERLLVGMKLLELLSEATGIVVLEREAKHRNDTPVYVTFSSEVVEWLEKMHGKCELLSPIHLPMIVPPRDWTNVYRGGYLSDSSQVKLISTRNRAFLDEMGGVDLPEVLASVNAIQATAWRINTRILAAVEEELQRGGNSAGLPRREDLHLPPRPHNVPSGVPTKDLTIDQRESLTVWKAKAAKVHTENAEARRGRVVLGQKLYVARRFAEAPAIYFPHKLDFRGRVYPIPSYVNPQSDDAGRSMLEFAEGKALGEDGAFWLAVHIAGLWGVDKVSFEDRVAWVFANEERILDSALDPHADDAFWRDADSPFQALAAALEWAGYKLEGDAFVSHLPIAMDGSCSGLQHYSAVLLDEVGGAAVNLVPGEKPSDIYTMVADRAQALSDGLLGETNPEMQRAWAGKVNRKVAKQPTMTLCYSATKYGMQGQIENALRKLDDDLGTPYVPGVERHAAAVYMAEIVWAALGDVVVAARTAMDWLKAASAVASKAGMPLRWTSPIGLPVLQEYREMKGSPIKVHFNGQRVELTLNTETDKMNSRRQSSGIAPNFVHALDASHLLATVNLAVDNGLGSFAMIHDSYAVHAADTSLLNVLIRRAFVAQYAEPVLERFRNELVEQLTATNPELVESIPPLPATGKLELSAVERSEFFFA